MNRENIKRWIVFSLLAVLAMLNWGCSTTAPEVGARAPAFTASTIDGETITLDELRGQPVFLNFWAINCWACRLQLPYIQAAFEEKGHEIKFIAIDSVDSSGAVQQYTEYYGLGFTMALDSYGEAARAYNIRYSPTNFLIDEQGVIKYIQIGAFRNQAELMAALDEYL
jgi:cytochrome c biogenesis protein CcmG/thiol:disulfide interchange protein DsbE